MENKLNYLQVLEQVAKDNNVELTEIILDKLEQYYNFLIEYNNNVNLTAITNKDEVYVKHFADSALGIKYFKKGTSVCDIGSGAGFPGVVLGIFRPDLKIILVDSLKKRTVFLSELIEKLDLTNIQVLHFRAEDNGFKNLYLNSFNYVTARAVAKLNTLLEYCLPFVAVGGEFIAYKSVGAAEEILLSKNALHVLGGKIVRCDDIKLSGMDRCIIAVQKTKKTTNLYPRSQNKPKNKPL